MTGGMREHLADHHAALSKAGRPPTPAFDAAAESSGRGGGALTEQPPAASAPEDDPENPKKRVCTL